MENAERQKDQPADSGFSSDPVMAKQLVQILSEVEANGEVGMTPPTVPPSDTTGAPYDSQELVSLPGRPSRIGLDDPGSQDNLIGPPPKTAIGKERSRESEGQEEEENDVFPVQDLALRPHTGILRPHSAASRPETRACGLECGPETVQRWMPREEDDRDNISDIRQEGDLWHISNIREDTPGRHLNLEDAHIPPFDESRECSKLALAKVPSMSEVLRNVWATRASEEESMKGRRRDVSSDWRHGEIYFEETGKVCRYLVVPNGDCEAADVARMLLDPGFGLVQPEMVFTAQSKAGNHWVPDEEIDGLRACGVRWPTDQDEARELYRRNVESLMLGVCTAASECSAWLMGSGRRSGGDNTGALFEQGIRQFAKVHPERENELCFLGLRGPCGLDVLEQAQVRLPPGMCPWSSLINPLTGDLIDMRRAAVPLWEEVSEQVRYPDVNELFTQRVSNGDHDDEILGCMCLNPTLSHLLLCTDLVKNKVQDFLESLLPAVHVVSSASSRSSLDHALNKACRGTQVLVLQNSGIWANALAKSVLERKGLCRRAAYVAVANPGARSLPIPDQIDVSKFLVFDVLVDSEERVVEKITNTLTTIAGEDTRELGFSNSERQRLQYAWDLYLMYTLNARRMLVWSRVAHYTLTAISLLTTTCAVLLTASKLEENGTAVEGEVSMFSYERFRFGTTPNIALALACSLLPLLSAFLLSVNSRFAPRTKYASFTASAAKVRSAIYKYRSRVGEYVPGVRNALLRNFAGDSGRRPLKRLVSRFRGPPAPEPRRPLPTPPHHPAADLRDARERATPAALLNPARETAPAGWALIGHSHSPSQLRFGTASAHGSRLSPVKERSSPAKDRNVIPDRKEKSGPKPSERFAEVLNSIHTELMAGVGKSGDMMEPTRKDWERLERSLGHRPPAHGSSFCGICTLCKGCCRRRSAHRVSPDAKVFGGTTDGYVGYEDAVLDNAFCLITADDYLHFRLKPLIAGLKVRAPLLARTWAATQMTTFVGTAIAGALGVLSIREYIPIVVAAVSAVDAIAQFEQLQVRMVATNSALAELQGMLLWWNSLSLVERRKSYIKEHLINVTEDVASSEAAVFGCSTRTQVSPRLLGEDEEEELNGHARRAGGRRSN